MKKIIVLGGGSAGGMTAYTLKKCFPEKEIVMIKSKDIPAIGVGESTLGHFKQWLSLVDIKDNILGLPNERRTFTMYRDNYSKN